MTQDEHDSESWWSYRREVLAAVKDLQTAVKELERRVLSLELNAAKTAGITSFAVTIVIEGVRYLIESHH